MFLPFQAHIRGFCVCILQLVPNKPLPRSGSFLHLFFPPSNKTGKNKHLVSIVHFPQRNDCEFCYKTSIWIEFSAVSAFIDRCSPNWWLVSIASANSRDQTGPLDHVCPFVVFRRIFKMELSEIIRLTVRYSPSERFVLQLWWVKFYDQQTCFTLRAGTTVLEWWLENLLCQKYQLTFAVKGCVRKILFLY